MWRLFWFDVAALHVFKGHQPRNAEAPEEGRSEVRRGDGPDSALVSLHARTVHSRAEELCGCGMEFGRSAGSGYKKQLGNSGHGRSPGKFAAGHARRRFGG